LAAFYFLTIKISPHPIFNKSSADSHTTFLSTPDRNTKITDQRISAKAEKPL
jgi:hypothetical protein